MKDAPDKRLTLAEAMSFLPFLVADLQENTPLSHWDIHDANEALYPKGT